MRTLPDDRNYMDENGDEDGGTMTTKPSALPITWRETTQEPAPPPPPPRVVTLTLAVMNSHGSVQRFATAADVIAAIEADDGLRKAVEERLGCEVAYERLEAERDEAEAHATAAESDRDAWKERAERAESAIAQPRILFMCGWRDVQIQDVTAALELEGIPVKSDATARHIRERFARARGAVEKAESERDTAIAQRREVEKERDEARGEVENARKEIEEACAILYNTGATRGDLLTRARRAVESHREHCVDWADHEETIARLERELAEAKGTEPREQSERDAIVREAAKIAAAGKADALELQARRALDEWERKALDLRQVGIDIIGQVFADAAGLREFAPDHVTLARKLGLIE